MTHGAYPSPLSAIGEIKIKGLFYLGNLIDWFKGVVQFQRMDYFILWFNYAFVWFIFFKYCL